MYNSEKILFLMLVFLFAPLSVQADPNDLNFDGVKELALDIPRLHRLLKLDPNDPPLEFEGEFEQYYLGAVFLDTGASGVLLSRETARDFGIYLDPEAEYIDVGVAGIEAFDVSEPLYIGTDYLNDPGAENPDNYLLAGPWRFQVKRFFVDPYSFDYPYDLLGMPIMAGKTVILYPGYTNELGYFAADVREPNDPTIPPVDFNIPVRFEKYINPNDPLQIPPLPVLAYNPVIDNITVEYNGQSSTGTWLFDTGGSISLISSKQATTLGLTDSNGTPIITPDFEVPIGGIGGQVDIPGYQIGDLTVPTLNGYNLVYNNARICVHDISIIDEDTGEFVTLDGIFGSNFLCASATLLLDIVETPYDTIVIDTQKGLLGFDVNDIYPLPFCGDGNHPQPTGDLNGDCVVNDNDYAIIADNYLRDDCNSANYYCDGADIDQNSIVNFDDIVILLSNWLQSSFNYIPNQIQSDTIELEHPWLREDINRDFSVNFEDAQILLEEWRQPCNSLNWNCRQADINGNGTVDFYDYAAILNKYD